ncbi:hypothetical protein GCM10009793_23980 [Brachybacterium phenoliresistens]
MSSLPLLDEICRSESVASPRGSDGLTPTDERSDGITPIDARSDGFTPIDFRAAREGPDPGRVRAAGGGRR